MMTRPQRARQKVNVNPIVVYAMTWASLFILKPQILNSVAFLHLAHQTSKLLNIKCPIGHFKLSADAFKSSLFYFSLVYQWLIFWHGPRFN